MTARPTVRPPRLGLRTVLATAAVLAPVVVAAPVAAAVPSVSRQAPSAAAEMPVRKLDRLVQKLRTDGRAVAVTAEVRRGGTTWAFDAGQARRGPGRPAEPGSSFRAASVTKQLVSVLALQLVERGGGRSTPRSGTWTPACGRAASR